MANIPFQIKATQFFFYKRRAVIYNGTLAISVISGAFQVPPLW